MGAGCAFIIGVVFLADCPYELGTTWALTEPKWVEKRRVTCDGVSFCVF